MSYSTNMRNKQQKERQRNILISWAVCFVLGILLGFLVTVAVTTANEANEPPVGFTEPISGAVSEMVKVTPVISTAPIPESTEPTESITSLGEFRITAYCPCEMCCGNWAKNRPVDEDGSVQVFTASGDLAVEGVTIAADTSILPFGTEVIIDDVRYIVQDRGGVIKDNQIDVYFENHQDALEFGVQYKEVFIERMIENDQVQP